MTPEVAKTAIQFLVRTQLQGQEVPAFNAVMIALQQIIEPKPEPKGAAGAKAG